MRQLNLFLRVDQDTELVATFNEHPGGRWEVRVENRQDRPAIESMIADISLYHLRRPIAPTEGDLYYEALIESLGRSSRLVLVEETRTNVLRSAIPTWIDGVQVVCLSCDIRGGNARLLVLDDPSNPDGRLVTLNIGDRAKIGSVDWELVSVDPVRTVDIPTGEIPIPGTSKATITLMPTTATGVST